MIVSQMITSPQNFKMTSRGQALAAKPLCTQGIAPRASKIIGNCRAGISELNTWDYQSTLFISSKINLRQSTYGRQAEVTPCFSCRMQTSKAFMQGFYLRLTGSPVGGRLTYLSRCMRRDRGQVRNVNTSGRALKTKENWISTRIVHSSQI